MRQELYPEIEPYAQGRLRVSDIHEIYYEEVGNPKGPAVIFLHGGPGGGVTPHYRRFFDPDHYRVILFDQRGAGKSTPHASLDENTTWDLVSDIEKIRSHLKVDRWIVFGGSWGSTLALTYATQHPEAVRGLALRGIFMCRRKELLWFYQDGASKIFPDQWDKYLAVIPEEERDDMMKAYYKRLTSDDRSERIQAARAWSQWEGSASQLIPDLDLVNKFGDDEFALAFARIECHYFNNGVFFDEDDYLLRSVDKIRHIPCQIVHGRYDVVCPVENAWELHKAWPEASLHIIPDAGHSAMERGIREKLVEIMEEWKELK